MVITGSSIAMGSTSKISQSYTQQTRIINPNSILTSSMTAVSLQLQNSSLLARNGKATQSGFNEYKNPSYKKAASPQTAERSNAGHAGGVPGKVNGGAKKIGSNNGINRSHGAKVSGGNRSFGIYSDFRYSLLDSIIKLLTGGKSDLLSINPHLSGSQYDGMRALKDEIERMRNLEVSVDSVGQGQEVVVQEQTLRLNLQQIETTTVFEEEQSMRFQAAGSVTTADGREINLEINLSMSSQFYSSNQTTITQVMKDPLVINLGPGNVTLTQTKFDFDIDNDGKSDQISFATGSSGFLAVDTYGDGKIRDGSQLFGALTGDGFAELARHDEDGNGWIDEADSLFDKLRIWMKDEDGNDRLMSLGEAGLGAIFLGNVSTSYNLRSDSGALDGQIRQTGIYLYENGDVGTIHHVDIAV